MNPVCNTWKVGRIVNLVFFICISDHGTGCLTTFNADFTFHIQSENGFGESLVSQLSSQTKVQHTVL